MLRAGRAEGKGLRRARPQPQVRGEVGQRGGGRPDFQGLVDAAPSQLACTGSGEDEAMPSTGLDQVVHDVEQLRHPLRSRLQFTEDLGPEEVEAERIGQAAAEKRRLPGPAGAQEVER